MPITPVKYTNSNTTLGFSGVDLADILLRREYFGLAGIYSWGYGVTSGQLGSGSTASRTSPGSLAGVGLTSWEWISASIGSGAAVRSDGTLWTWGASPGDGSTIAKSSPVQIAGGGTNWDEVAMSTTHGVAVKNDGSLWTWGRNTNGELGTGNTTARSSPLTTAVANTPGDSWKSVAAAGSNLGALSASIKNDGTLWTWGYNLAGQLGDGTNISKSSPVQVAGGGTWDKVAISGISGVNSGHMVGIKTDGTLWTWGGNNNGQLGTGATSNARSSPGSIVAAASTWTWKDVACGYTVTAGIKTDGTLYTWGTNSSGQLGDGSTLLSRTSPGTVAGGGTTWKKIAISTVGAGIKTDGTLWTWGNDANGQLGDGSTNNRSSPQTVTGSESNWKQVAVSETTSNYVLALAENETYFPQISTYVVPGSFTETIPAGMSSAFFEAWGGGGGGGDGYGGSPGHGGGGGGSGGYSRTSANVRYQVGKTIGITVGGGGGSGGNTQSPGSPGNASNVYSITYTFTKLTANGGFGGSYATAPAGGGLGGTAAGGTDVNTTGNTGGVGGTIAGGPGAAGVAGRNSVIYGSGGNGAQNNGVGETNGANGAVIITYY